MIVPDEILFWIPTHNDADRLANALSSIRAIYPCTGIVVYCDRDPLADVSASVAAYFGAQIECYEGDAHFWSWPRIRTLHQEWLRSFDSRGRNWFIKFDTDARLLRPFSLLPHGCVFANMVKAAWGLFPQGGCYGTDRATAQRLLAQPPPSLEEVEAQPDLQSLRQPFDEWRNLLRAEDRFFGWLAHRADVPFCECPEIASVGRMSEVPERRARTAAVIHPVRDFSVGQKVVEMLGEEYTGLLHDNQGSARE